MFKKRVFKILTVVMLFVFSMNMTVEGRWLENWYDQAIRTSPEYIKGQQRGYFTLGSFSARTQTDTLYPVSIQKPRLNVGCGGIDIFLGGFSFLNLEYLVELAQRMIQVAPYIAFKIALETISQQLSGTVGEAQQIINFLNSLQFNECSFMEGFMVKLWNTGDITAALNEGATKAGVVPFWKKGTESTRSDRVVGVQSKKQIEGCPREVQNILLNLNNTGLIDNVARKRGYNNPELIGIIRATIGDIYIKFDDEGVPKLGYIEPCGDIFSEVDSKKKLKIRRSWNSQCEEYDLSQFVMKVKNDLYSLYNQIREKRNAVNAPNYQLLNPRKAPLPVYMITKTAILANDPSILELSVDPIAYGYLVRALLEVLSLGYADVQKIFSELTSVEQVNHEAQTQDPTKVCKVPQLTLKYAEMLIENRDRALRSLDVTFKNVFEQINSFSALIERYERYYRSAASQISKKFGQTVMIRALGF
jgi:conjugative transfer pilus assembly protein TraH